MRIIVLGLAQTGIEMLECSEKRTNGVGGTAESSTVKILNVVSMNTLKLYANMHVCLPVHAHFYGKKKHC